MQIGAIISGVQPGLTMVVGPPGTGKTDTAVQILNLLYHNCPSQRTLIITHSNQALNDLFEKIMQVLCESLTSIAAFSHFLQSCFLKSYIVINLLVINAHQLIMIEGCSCSLSSSTWSR